ncbi:UNVERIFIED_CONTAM: hypothetical protein GTU68_059550 [Idotea baltica]|nr:hypothetical protein [Idotea baltica]
MAHTGIGTLPILYYGNETQKAQYVPKLASGEWKASYCLTEPDAGSDANSGKTKATLTEDGKHYLINGQKMWITNGGFADVLIVFAKIENDKNMSAFIVEKTFGGITMNEEEKKMGIKGSSTRQIFFNDCKVPVENMLSVQGNGFKIALNILNIGRIKLGVGAIGGAKGAMDNAINYANERKQFGTTIGSFGAIKHKIGDVAAAIFASEAAHYRAGQNIDDACADMIANGMDESQAKQTLDYAVDEGVQIYGGMGYSAEAPMERGYRDARINRIFEGTNEINRILTVDMILKRAMKGELDLMGPAMAVAKELTSIPNINGHDDDAIFNKEKQVIRNLKKAGLMIAGAAVQKLAANLEHEQEILMNLADIMIQIYAAESALLRAEKVLIQEDGSQRSDIYMDLARIYLYTAVEKCSWAGKQAIYAFADGDEMRMMLMGLKRFTKVDPYNLKNARRRVADHLLAKNEYVF